MAEQIWSKRWAAASAVVLSGAGLMAFLDASSRPGPTPPLLLGLGTALVAAALASWHIDWASLERSWRLAPALIVLACLLLAVVVGDTGASAAAPVGLTLLSILIMVYVGFVSTPGLALALSPMLLFTLLVAYWRQPDRVSLALPLLAVPASALLAELISSLLESWLEARDLVDHRSRRLARLERVVRRFSAAQTMDDAAHDIARAARDVFETPRTTVVLRDRDDRLIPVTEGPVGIDDTGPDTGRIIAEALAGGEPRFAELPAGGTVLVMPLSGRKAPTGAVLAYPIDPTDSESTISLARLFGTQVGIAVEQLHLIHELTEASRVDELTGIGNRRHADDLLASLIPGDALILIDLDSFKQVNDNYGHPAGDQLLQSLSAHLRSCLRDSDTSARLGGDEFLIVARRAHADPLAVAQRILEGWDERRRSSPAFTPTISAGVALHERERTSAETYDRADQALLQAKRRGKNQAQLWEPVSPG